MNANTLPNRESNPLSRISIERLMLACGLSSVVREIDQSPAAYPVKDSVEENWSFFSILALRKLAVVRRRRSFGSGTVAIVGIGSGVEGIAAVEIFGGSAQRLVITDVAAPVVRLAAENILPSVSRTKMQLRALVGSLCEPLSRAAFAPDVICGNIPNLPVPAGVSLDFGEERGTFHDPADVRHAAVPVELERWALSAQLAFLESAGRVLAPNGCVVAMLGGRMPWDVIEGLFDYAGFALTELITGYKVQSEALIDFEGYARFEERFGVTFEFYRSSWVWEQLRSIGQANPLQMGGRELKRLLAPAKVSATEAVTLHAQGIAIGHTVHALCGAR